MTRPFLPPLGELMPLLEEIWERRIVTNRGPFHEQLEGELASFLEIEHISLTANGMLALEAGIDALGVSGEVITTPYSFVATTHAVKRAGLEPVFVDIRPDDLNIDPSAVEAAITDRTQAIVAVHCYGNPCDVESLDDIARRHSLALIYDAAHAFGVRLHGRSLVSWGDFATLSFHGTKVFNTFEGGAVVSKTAQGKRAIDFGRNFGIAGEVSIPRLGTNAKMSEFNAALGLVQLKHFAGVRSSRCAVDRRYREGLRDVPGIEMVQTPAGVEPNFSYFPVLVKDAYPLSRDALYERLKRQGVFSRRYFYPLLSRIPMYRDLPSAAPENLPIATRTAKEVLCLPIYHDLSSSDQERIIGIIRS